MLRTKTSTSLLEGLKDPGNDAVWSAWVGRYRPVIVGFAKRGGLGDDEAEDVAQATLLAFSVDYREGRYERERGGLRAWLFGIASNRLREARSKARRESSHRTALDALDREPEDPRRFEDQWEAEWRDAVLAAALEEVKAEVEAKTWEAFSRFAIEGRPAAEVAEELAMTANAVFGAKRRVLDRVKAVLPLVEDAF